MLPNWRVFVAAAVDAVVVDGVFVDGYDKDDENSGEQDNATTIVCDDDDATKRNVDDDDYDADKFLLNWLKATNGGSGDDETTQNWSFDCG